MKDSIKKEQRPVTQKALDSFKWSASIEILSRVSQPFVYIILARLLTPYDFGLVATAMIVINFTRMFWEASLGKALIQTKESSEEAAHVVFWTDFVLGLVIYGILFLAAPWLAIFFNNPASMLVLRVLGIQVLILSLTSVPKTLFVRDLDFRQLFWVKLATAFVPAFFSVPLALFGFGVWALVAGTLASTSLDLVLLWSKSAYRPRMHFNWHIARRLFSFGGWVIGESLGGWFMIYGDNLFVVKYLGTEALGSYSVGWNITSIIFGTLMSPFSAVLYPTFSRLQDDAYSLKLTFYKAIRLIMLLALPMGTGLLLIGPQLVSILFGDKWHCLRVILSLIGFLCGISWLVGINPELYRAMGRPDVNTKLTIVNVAFYLPAFLIAAPFGLEVFTIVRLGVGLVFIPIHVYLCVRMLGVSPLYLWHEGKPMILATLVMGAVVGGSKWLLSQGVIRFPGLVTLVLFIVIGILTYGGTLWLLDRSFMLQTKNLIKKVALT